MKEITWGVAFLCTSFVYDTKALPGNGVLNYLSQHQQTSSEGEYFPTENEWNTLMSDAVASGEIDADEVITYAELEVCEYRWKDRRESSNVEDRRLWDARHWLWWATSIGQY